MRQSRLPIPGWSLVQGFASIMLTVTRLAPKLPNEVDVSGESLQRYKEKHARTSWEVHDNCEKFLGPIKPFCMLVHYLDKSKTHKMHENTRPGFSVGWKIESSWRYRGIVLIGDYYQKLLAGDFCQRSLL